jgi:hypothetical protein
MVARLRRGQQPVPVLHQRVLRSPSPIREVLDASDGAWLRRRPAPQAAGRLSNILAGGGVITFHGDETMFKAALAS